MDGREGGYIKLHRRVKSWPLWRHMTALQRMVVVEVLLSANWRDRDTWLGKVGRGELAQSEDTIAAEAKVSRKVVRQTIAILVAEGFLRRREVGKVTGPGRKTGIESGSDRAVDGIEKGLVRGRNPNVLTVLNYEKYQGEDFDEGQPEGLRRACEGPAKGLRRASLEEGEEGEELPFAAHSAPGPDAAPPHPDGVQNGAAFALAPVPGEAAAAAPKPKPRRRAAAVTDEPRDPRHHPVRQMLAFVYAEMRMGAEMPWGPAHATQLKRLLASVPSATLDDFEKRWRYSLGLGRQPGTANPLTFLQRWPELVPGAASPQNGVHRVIANGPDFQTEESREWN